MVRVWLRSREQKTASLVAQLDKCIQQVHRTRARHDQGVEQRRKRSLQEVLASAIGFLKRSQHGPESNVLVDAAMRAGLLSSHELFCVELRMPDAWDRASHFPVVAAGQGAQRFLRESPWADLRGHAFSIIVHPDDRPTLQSVVRFATSGGGRGQGPPGSCGRARLRLVHFYTASVSRQTSGEAQDCRETFIASEYISLDLQLTGRHVTHEAAEGQVDGEGAGVLLLLADLHTAKPQIAPTVREIDEGDYLKLVRDSSDIRACHSELGEGTHATASSRRTGNLSTAAVSFVSSESSAFSSYTFSTAVASSASAASLAAHKSSADDEPLPWPLLGAPTTSRRLARHESSPGALFSQSRRAQNQKEQSAELGACKPLQEFYDWLNKSDEAGKVGTSD